MHRDMAYGEPEPGSSSVPARMGFRFPSGQEPPSGTSPLGEEDRNIEEDEKSQFGKTGDPTSGGDAEPGHK